MRDKEIKLMIVNMLQDLSHRYSSYNNNIKYMDSTIKYIGFTSSNYAINLYIISFFMILTILIIYFYRCIVSLNK